MPNNEASSNSNGNANSSSNTSNSKSNDKSENKKEELHVEIPKFDGEPKNYDAFMSMVQLKWVFNNTEDEMAKTIMILSNLTGKALGWAQPHISSLAENSQNFNHVEFRDKFKAAFEDKQKIFKANKAIVDIRANHTTPQRIVEIVRENKHISNIGDIAIKMIVMCSVNEQLREKLDYESTLETMLNKVMEVTTFLEALNDKTQKEVSYDNNNNSQSNNSYNSKPGPYNKFNNSNKRCNFCRMDGHIRSECRTHKKMLMDKLEEERKNEKFVNNFANNNKVLKEYKVSNNLNHIQIKKDLVSEKHKDKTLFNECKINGKIFQVVIDTGSNITVVPESLTKKLKIKTENNDLKTTLKCINDSSVIIINVIDNLPVEVMGKKVVLNRVPIIKSTKEYIILGLDFIKAAGLKYDQQWTINHIGPDRKAESGENDNQTVDKENTEEKTDNNNDNNNDNEYDNNDKHNNNNNNKGEDYWKSKYLSQFSKVFQNKVVGGKSSAEKVKIDLLPNTRYDDITSGWRQTLNQNQQETLDKLIQELLENDIIEPTDSPTISPLIMIEKPNGGQRLVLDVRKLNKRMLKKQFPMPIPSELFAYLSKAVIFSSVDLKDAFWQLPLDEESKRLCAFQTRQGNYQFKVMPNGLKIAPQAFQGYLQQIFRKELFNNVLVYFDDILIFSESEKEHDRHVTRVLEILDNNGLVANIKKSRFHQEKIEFLGLKVSKEGIEPIHDKLQPIMEWKEPSSLKEVQNLIGMINVYKRFIPNISILIKPITHLLKKKTKFKWGDEQQNALNQLKKAFKEDIILQHPDFDQEFYLTTDASNYGIAAVLTQLGKEGEHMPISFYSRQLTNTEQAYGIGQKELLAITEGLRVHYYYLRMTKVTIRTDHNNLTYMTTEQKLSQKIMRAAVYISQFDYKIEFIKGIKNHADVFSRDPKFQQFLKEISTTIIPKNKISKTEGEGTAEEEKTFHVNYVLEIDDDEDGEGKEEEERQEEIGEDKGKAEEQKEEIVGNKEKVEEQEKKDSDGSGENDKNDNINGEEKGDNEKEKTKPFKTSLDELDIIQPMIDLDEIMNNNRDRDSKIIINNKNDKLKIMTLFHDNYFFGGHRGVKSTTEHIKEHFTWTSMNNDIQKYVGTCQSCARNKARTHKPYGKLHPLEIAKIPWRHISLDFIGPLSQSNGYNSILVIVDRFTKEAIFIPTNNTATSSETFDLVFKHVICDKGCPETIISDRGSQFITELWRHLFKLMKCTVKLSSANHPQTDGQTERTNKTLKEYLRNYANYSHDNWSKLLPMAQFAYNNSKSASTGFTPYQLSRGYNPRIMFEKEDDSENDNNNSSNNKNNNSNDNSNNNTNNNNNNNNNNEEEEIKALDKKKEKALNLTLERFKNIRKVWKTALENIEKAVKNYSKYANEKRDNGPELKKGDYVYLSTEHLQRLQPTVSLSPKYIGPLKVLEKVTDVTYRIELPTGYRNHDVFHISLLEKCYFDENKNRFHAPPPPIIIRSENNNDNNNSNKNNKGGENKTNKGKKENGKVLKTGSSENNNNNNNENSNEEKKEVLWHIEKIVDSRKTKDKKLEYKIRWKGLDESEDTWEPAENFKKFPLLKRKFHMNFPVKPYK